MHKSLSRALCAIAVLGACAAAPAQDLTFKAPAQERTVAIVNATIHPVGAPDIERGFVVFEKGVISRVGAGDAPSDAGWEVIDAAGKHVYPGLVGASSQMGLLEIGMVRATVDYAETGAMSPEVRAVVAVNPDSTVIPVTRTAGVLTCGVMPMGGTMPGRAGVIRMDGWTWEDLTIDDDAGLMLNWPNVRPVSARWMSRGEEEQRTEFDQSLSAIDRAFDDAAAYLAARASDTSLAADLRWEAMRPVLAKEDPLFIRAEELEQIQSAVSWAAGRGLKCVIVGGRDSEQCADLLKKHDVGVILTGTFKLPRRRDSAYDEAYTLPARLEAAGVRWCLATTADPFNTPHERNLPYHAAISVAHGLDRGAALRSITLSAAELLGVADRLGSIEEGKAATIIVTDGDPLEITTKVERAFIDGRAIDLSNKQTVLEKKYREKYRQLGVKREE